MHRKYLQQSLSVIKHDEDQHFEVEYYLIESDRRDQLDLTLKEDFPSKAYGIEIIKKLKNDLLVENKKECSCESELIFDYSSCESKTKCFIEKLARNHVTPISLRYVIEDTLGE